MSECGCGWELRGYRAGQGDSGNDEACGGNEGSDSAVRVGVERPPSLCNRHPSFINSMQCSPRLPVSTAISPKMLLIYFTCNHVAKHLAFQ